MLPGGGRRARRDYSTNMDDVMMQRTRAPEEWIAMIGDHGVYALLEAAGPSPYLARYGISPRDDDGVVCAQLTIDGQPFLIAVQDSRFLGGSVGQQHARRLARLLRTARETRVPVLLLLASGGVRLHEANPAEVALAQALRELVDTRAAGVPVLGLVTGNVFGGASVLACATSRLAMLPGTRLGLSGPKVIAMARGIGEVNPDDDAALTALFGDVARCATGFVDRVPDSAQGLRNWCAGQSRLPRIFAHDVAKAQRDLALLLGPRRTVLNARVLTRGTRADVQAFRAEVDAAGIHAVDTELLQLPPEISAVVFHEDSQGHAVSREAEEQFLSRYLAQHVAVLGLLRARGVALIGVLHGVGHSAAFFANALQADRLYVLPTARILAMEPSAVAQVTGRALGRPSAGGEDDPVLGESAMHLVALGAAERLDPAVTLSGFPMLWCTRVDEGAQSH